MYFWHIIDTYVQMGCAKLSRTRKSAVELFKLDTGRKRSESNARKLIRLRVYFEPRVSISRPMPSVKTYQFSRFRHTPS